MLELCSTNHLHRTTCYWQTVCNAKSLACWASQQSEPLLEYITLMDHHNDTARQQCICWQVLTSWATLHAYKSNRHCSIAEGSICLTLARLILHYLCARKRMMMKPCAWSTASGYSFAEHAYDIVRHLHLDCAAHDSETGHIWHSGSVQSSVQHASSVPTEDFNAFMMCCGIEYLWCKWVLYQHLDVQYRVHI